MATLSHFVLSKTAAKDYCNSPMIHDLCLEFKPTEEALERKNDTHMEVFVEDLRIAILQIFEGTPTLTAMLGIGVGVEPTAETLTVLFQEVPPDVMYSVRSAMTELIDFELVDDNVEPEWHGRSDGDDYQSGKEDYSTVDTIEWNDDSAKTVPKPFNRIEALTNPTKKTGGRIFKPFELN